MSGNAWTKLKMLKSHDWNARMYFFDFQAFSDIDKDRKSN